MIVGFNDEQNWNKNSFRPGSIEYANNTFHFH